MLATNRNLKIALLGVLSAIAGSWISHRYLLLRHHFTAAEQAYQAAQCQEAIASYQIERPGLSGYPNDGSTVVEIRNDSPEEIRLVFSGPQPRYEEIEPCTDCETFVGQDPEGCPDRGPIQRYVLKPGQYDVVVKSISGRVVRPFTGTWQLDPNAVYSNCFFIVQQPS
jgi:hypothetical protein